LLFPLVASCSINYRRATSAPELDAARALAYGSAWIISLYSASVNAFKVVVGTAPPEHKRLYTWQRLSSLVDLQAAINRYLAEHNQSPKPFVWTANPDTTIAAASRGYQVLDSIH
jgi:hypothetical protein